MITPYTIDATAWTAISTAGQAGTCWVESVTCGGGKLRIYHSTLGVPALSVKDQGYPLWVPNKNFDAAQLEPDDANDIFYAIADQLDSVWEIRADVI